ncbi:hypothetical protein ABFV54_25055, partial [Pseudomonas syringae]|uniref:hypothetical protein n=1 Tax=Pseudomonas syringae TaxID=317 RepID=UPI0034D47EC6
YYWIHQVVNRSSPGSRMIDHRLGGGRQEVGMVLEKPASAGFLLGAIKSSSISDHVRGAFRLRRL